MDLRSLSLYVPIFSLTLSQMTNFALFLTERAISPFPTVFSKDLYSKGLFGKGLIVICYKKKVAYNIPCH